MPSHPPNRLQHSTSPYLLQHAHNPVDWYPWGHEAFAAAREKNRPIFLSIGYSACHWCHVMERESFEHADVATLLNAHFVSIKVDREERPDLDDLYMSAVHALTGRGGWPMSVWLTPDLLPFYGGTYFPREGRPGMPGLLDLLRHIESLWATRQADVIQDAQTLTRHLQDGERIPSVEISWQEVTDAALGHFRRTFDPRWGGFGDAPKFPPHGALALLMRVGSPQDRAMAWKTLQAMADGGIHDHIGGGFARYSVDAQWHIPHFEKMLCDNAQLASTYALAHFQAPDQGFDRVAQRTLDYLLRDMADEGGGFHSAEDADSEGEEGRFYLWTPEEVLQVLGQEGPRFCEAYDIIPGGNFEGGRSLPRHIQAGVFMENALSRLHDARSQRIRPSKDDKVITAWNGLALRAFAHGYRVLGQPRYLAAAQRAARFLCEHMANADTLLRAWRRGVAHTPGVLEDYGAVALGLVDLFEMDGDRAWLHRAESLGNAILRDFADPVTGCLYTSGAGRDDLILRQRARHDHALPSGATLAVEALLRLATHAERPDFQTAAVRAANTLAATVARAPWAFPAFLAAIAPALTPAGTAFSTS